MTHHVRQLVENELSQMDWSGGVSKQKILEHFRMAPTVREAFEKQLPSKSFRSADEVMHGLPDDDWRRIEEAIRHGSPDSHYLQSRAAQFDPRGKTPGFGQISEAEQNPGEQG